MQNSLPKLVDAERDAIAFIHSAGQEKLTHVTKARLQFNPMDFHFSVKRNLRASIFFLLFAI